MITKADNKVFLRDECVQLIKDNSFKRVVDIGGAMFPWAREVVTHYIDMNDPKKMCGPEFDCEQFDKAVFFQGDICLQETWNEACSVLQPFDFAICSQTLEDIRDPTVALRNLPRIAKAGFITVPVKYRELNFVEGHGETEQREWNLKGAYRGYFHHRWIFTLDNGLLKLFPKLNFVECLKGLEWADNQVNNYTELAFFWEDDIPFEIINNDFLGPNPPSMFDMYRKFMEQGL